MIRRTFFLNKEWLELKTAFNIFRFLYKCYQVSSQQLDYTEKERIFLRLSLQEMKWIAGKDRRNVDTEGPLFYPLIFHDHVTASSAFSMHAGDMLGESFAFTNEALRLREALKMSVI